MASLFRRRTLDPRVVPTADIEIDWAHPLANGLIACYIPGSTAGLTDLCGIGPRLYANSAGAIITTPLGPGLRSEAGGGAVSTVRPTMYERGTGGSTGIGTNLAIAHLGVHTGPYASVADDVLFGIVRSGGTTPYYGYAFALSAYSNNTIHIVYSHAGALGDNPTAIGNAFIGLNSFITTFGTEGHGPVNFYQNGIVQAKTGGYTGNGGHDMLANPFSYFSDDVLAIGSYPPDPTRRLNGTCLAEMMWDTGAVQMTPDQAAWLSAEPFAMLKPVTRRSWFVLPVPTAYPSGIARAPALGTIFRTAGAVSVQPIGIARTPALGSATRTLNAVGGHPLGIVRTPALGTIFRVAGGVAAHPGGIVRTPALGVVTGIVMGGPQSVHATGIARNPALGSVVGSAGAVSVQPAGTALAPALGDAAAQLPFRRVAFSTRPRFSPT